MELLEILATVAFVLIGASAGVYLWKKRNASSGMKPSPSRESLTTIPEENPV